MEINENKPKSDCGKRTSIITGMLIYSLQLFTSNALRQKSLAMSLSEPLLYSHMPR